MKVKVKSLSRVRLLATPWTVAYQAPPSMGSPGKSAGAGCHSLPSSSGCSRSAIAPPKESAGSKRTISGSQPVGRSSASRLVGISTGLHGSGQRPQDCCEPAQTHVRAPLRESRPNPCSRWRPRRVFAGLRGRRCRRRGAETAKEVDF